MKIAMSELNELALIVSNVFKYFDASTMFYHSNNQVIFTNYNNEGVEPPKDQIRPFGTQAVLESFAKSLGFKTYKGMLVSEVSEVDLTTQALYPLNPNPLNKFYTDIWESLTTNLMTEILNKQTLSSKFTRNFKKSELAKYSGFSCLRGSFIGSVDIDCYGSFKVDPHSVYYRSLAHAVVLNAIEKLLEREGISKDLEKNELNKLYDKLGYKLSPINVAFSDFLVRPMELDDEFVNQLIRSIWLNFDIKAKVVSSENSGGRILSLEINKAILESFGRAKVFRINFDNTEKALIPLLSESRSDKTKYKCRYSLHIKNQDGIAKHLREVAYYKNDKSQNIILHGTKSYWMNMVVGMSFNGIESLDPIENIDTMIIAYVDGNLSSMDKKTINKNRDFKSYQYSSVFSLSGQWDSYSISYPEYITIVSDEYGSSHYHALAVQAELDHILEESKYTIEKTIGNPQLFELNPDIIFGTPKTKLKMKLLKDSELKGEIVKFNPLLLINELRLLYIENEDGESLSMFDDTNEDVIVFKIDLQLIDLPFKLKKNRIYESGFGALAFDVAIDRRSKKIVNVEYQSEFEDKDIKSPLGHYDYYDLCSDFFELDAVEDMVSKFLMQFYKVDNETYTRLESIESAMGLVIYPSSSIRSGKPMGELIKKFHGV